MGWLANRDERRRAPAMSSRPWGGVAIVLLVLGPAAAGAQDITEAAIRDAATRGFAAIQTAQKVSWKTQTCAGTCHLQGYGSMAYRSAREHGIAVDEEIQRADATKAWSRLSSDLATAIEQNALGEPAMNAAFFLVSAHAVGLRPTVVTAALARALALQQNPAGDWVALSTCPPSNYSAFTFTAIGMRALQLFGHANQARDTAERVARARNWLESHQPQHTEERAYQLLGLRWAGVDPGELAPRARDLLRGQQADGGWTSLDGRPADAYATGQALVALHDAVGMSLGDEAWRRGIAFLLRTQAPDGTWRVATRLPAWVSPPYYESGYPYGRDQFISVSGASWAVMALTRALGKPVTPQRLPLDSVAPAAIDPWVETALFGSTGGLRRLLDEGLNPNATTTAGRVPLLNLVVPDVEKVRLLLDRGADANARSQAGYPALLVASQYASADAAIQLLLDRNGQVRMPAGGATLANAYPTFFAAHAGNAEVLPLFRRAGDSVDAPASLLRAPVSPLYVAATFGRLDAARALLDLGAPVNQPEARGRTALGTAVLNNRPDVVRLLIERGADVNHADTEGRTPLIYAAAIDFGSSTIADMLLRAGARPGVRDKEGLTALERARRDGNTHVIASLERAERER